MSLVVSDSGPIHYLILCEAIEILPKLHGGVVIPPTVEQELTHSHTPAIVSQWIQAPPVWISVQRPSEPHSSIHLGLGEREAIALAAQLKATRLLVDDRVAPKSRESGRPFDSGDDGTFGTGCHSWFSGASASLREAFENEFQD